MKTACPFCKQVYNIEAEHLDQQIACSACKRRFTCVIVATPSLGPMYLDIETTGAPDKSYAEISSIVWWCNREWHSWVNGRDDPEMFLLYWQHAPQIITFNGKAFDEPKICTQFTVGRHSNHTDLFIEAKHLGLLGGLKEIGTRLGFPRPHDLDNVNGLTAIRLWRSFCLDKDPDALQNLLYYNAWDVALTYLLHMQLINEPPDPIHESIPFRYGRENMLSFLPKPRQPRKINERKIIGKIKDYWSNRKENPLTKIRDAEVCFTGDLKKIEREAAEELIESLGGTVKSFAVQTLDFLVVGDVGPGTTTKMDKAEEYIGKGAHTRIINEDEFWALVKNTQKLQT